MVSAGCDGGDGSAASPAAPPPSAPPSPAPPPPAPPEPETWIGFADPARASLFAGGRVRAVIVVSGEPLTSPVRLTVDRSAPADQLVVPEEIEIDAYAHGAVEIVGIGDRGSEGQATYQITLLPPPEGLPARVALTEAATTYHVTLNGGNREPDCARLELDATRERFDSRGEFSTARITLEGPQNVALRLSEPYWTERLKERENPPELSIDLSAAPPITLAIPSSLPYRPLAAGGHRQQVSLSWYGDLRLAAVVPGCKPVQVRCERVSSRTTRCSP